MALFLHPTLSIIVKNKLNLLHKNCFGALVVTYDVSCCCLVFVFNQSIILKELYTPILNILAGQISLSYSLFLKNH